MHFDLFAGVSAETTEEVLAQTRRLRFGRGAILFHEADPSDGMHLVASGWVAVRLTTPMGDVATVAVVGADEPLGEQSLMGQQGRRSTSAVALSAVETLFLSRVAFDALREHDPSVDRFIAALFDDRLRRVTARLVEALYVPAPKRALRRIADLARQFGRDEIPLTQEDIASLAGTTRPTVNRALGEAEDLGAVALSRGRVRVIDEGTLASLLG